MSTEFTTNLFFQHNFVIRRLGDETNWYHNFWTKLPSTLKRAFWTFARISAWNMSNMVSQNEEIIISYSLVMHSPSKLNIPQIARINSIKQWYNFPAIAFVSPFHVCVCLFVKACLSTLAFIALTYKLQTK